MEVSIRPSPKGEGNFATQWGSTKVTVQFQSALHPKVKGISVIDDITHKDNASFNPPFTQR